MTQSSAWAYLAVFLLMALAFIGIPAVGPAVVGWAAVLASRRHARPASAERAGG
jgi:hypothetical protein